MSDSDHKKIYLDYAATTPVDPRVLEQMLPYFSENFGNISSVHSWGQKAKEAVIDSRQRIADRLNCSAEEILFTGSGTESANLAIKGAAEANQEKGRHIIASEIEHHAVLEPLDSLEDKGFEVTYVSVDEKGFVNPEEIREAIRPETILITVMYANNEMGAIQPIKKIGEIAREHGVPFHTDACQAAGKLPLDVEELNVDLMTINASKIYGPKGVGVLYVKNGVDLEPLIVGGGQEKGLRGGTENVPAIVGMAAALDLVVAEQEQEMKRLKKIRDLMIAELEAVEGAFLNGPRENRLANNINMSFIGVEGESMLLRLDMEGVAVSSGSACSSNTLEPSHVLKAMGLSDERVYSSIRFSLGKSVSEEDVKPLLDRVSGVVRDLRSVSF